MSSVRVRRMQERNPERAPHVLPRLGGLEIWCVKDFSGWGVHGFRVYRAHQLCKLTSLALCLSLSCVFCLLFVVLSLSLSSLPSGLGKHPMQCRRSRFNKPPRCNSRTPPTQVLSTLNPENPSTDLLGLTVPSPPS